MPSTIELAIAIAIAIGAACRPAKPTESPEPARATPAAATAVSDREADPDPERDAALHRLARIGVVGASLSAGFGEGVPLHEMLDATLVAPHAIFDAASSGLFLRPRQLAEVEIGLMRLRSVRLVVAVDFLFWFAYGDKADAQRHADLEAGLSMLDTLEVPMLVGDLPDVHGASPKMIAPRQIPDREVLEALNDRIEAWAAARPSVRLVPMSAWTDALKAGTPPEIDGIAIGPGDRLLQWDGLHPTARGQAVLAVLLGVHLRALLPGLRATDVVAEPDAALARMRAARGWDRLPAPPPNG